MLTVMILYYLIGFNAKTVFWQSVLPSVFVDILSVLVTTFLITKLIEIKRDYKEKEEFYRVLKNKHIKMIYQLEYDYLSVISTVEGKEISQEIYLTDVLNYLEKQDDNFLNHIILKSGKEISREEGFNSMRQDSLEKLHNYISVYGTLMPLDYKKILFELDNILDGLIASSLSVKISGIKEFKNEQESFVKILSELVTYFDDIDKGRVSVKGNKNYGWGIILLVSLIFIVASWVINFCIYLYNM
ncbi:hypothetical protein [Sporosarcina highlanderae]|uniref:SMODS and SLOG-associating 2TM effector domain-containing protein n=1 Tax=Sporosarcina highlanderae TaxID=3035916 RepID=A0ABT8JTM1_9BACL|nr:hypothetical protein [Sporosarcina highlanderae]MDN4607906.1 hypothetical protein [Sporosarcina highlanderae]